MTDFITKDIEYLHLELSKINVLPDLTLYDALAEMTRYTKNVYLIKLKNSMYRAVYDIHHEIFEGDTETDTLYKMVMSFIENDESYIIKPLKKPDHILQSDWEVLYGKLNIPKVRYVDISKI